MDEKLLDGRFFLFPSCAAKCEVFLTRQNIMYRRIVSKPNGKPRPYISILMENIVGSRIFESRIKKDNYCCLTVHMLLKNKKGNRERQQVTFCIYHSDDKQENITIAETWARTISWLARYPNISVDELQGKK